MSAILNSLNAHNFLIFQPIFMILVSKFKVYRALSDKTYLLLGLRSPLILEQGGLHLYIKCKIMHLFNMIHVLHTNIYLRLTLYS